MRAIRCGVRASRALAALFWLAAPGPAAAEDAPAAVAPARLVVAKSASWVPYAFRDADGEPRGVLIDLWRKVGARDGVELTFELVTWRESLERVAAAQADLHGGLTRSKAREARLDFSAPIIRVTTQLFARTSAGVDALAALEGRRVGVVEGTVEQGFLAKYWPGVEATAFADSEAMVRAALDGALDAFVADYPTGHYRLIQAQAVDLFETADTLYTEDIHAAVPN